MATRYSEKPHHLPAAETPGGFGLEIRSLIKRLGFRSSSTTTTSSVVSEKTRPSPPSSKRQSREQDRRTSPPPPYKQAASQSTPTLASSPPPTPRTPRPYDEAESIKRRTRRLSKPPPLPSNVDLSLFASLNNKDPENNNDIYGPSSSLALTPAPTPRAPNTPLVAPLRPISSYPPPPPLSAPPTMTTFPSSSSNANANGNASDSESVASSTTKANSNTSSGSSKNATKTSVTAASGNTNTGTTPKSSKPRPVSLDSKAHKSKSRPMTPPKDSGLDTSGRKRPPISGLGTGVKSPSNPSSTTSPNGHTYHYKRARTASSSGNTPDALNKRTQEAVLCLEALLAACEAGAVEDVRHVVEQVALARNILVGDEDGIGLPAEDNKTNEKKGKGIGGGVKGASSSVTSLATLSNLVPW